MMKMNTSILMIFGGKNAFDIFTCDIISSAIRAFLEYNEKNIIPCSSDKLYVYVQVDNWIFIEILISK